MKYFLDQLPPSSVISRIRRNHGLEHATIHILTQKSPGTRMAGHSDANGFWILGNVESELVQQAVSQALNRLRAGERRLAIHPNCGTNFATSGALAGLAGAFSMFGASKRWQDRAERLPLAMVLATLVLIFSRPLGLRIQEQITTSGVPGELQAVKITPSQRGKIKAHRITTRG